jgi:hypothetical protein
MTSSPPTNVSHHAVRVRRSDGAAFGVLSLLLLFCSEAICGYPNVND